MKITKGRLVGWGFGLAFGHAKFDDLWHEKQVMATFIFGKWRWNIEF